MTAWERVKLALAYVLSGVGWICFVLDNPSVLLRVGLCDCGHKEMHHANDDSRQCLLCEPASLCPGFYPAFQKPKRYLEESDGR